MVGNLVRVLADLVDDSLHRLCGPAEDVTCDKDNWVTSGTLITGHKLLTYQLLLVEPGEGGRQLDGRRGEGGGEAGHQGGGGEGASAAWSCYWSIDYILHCDWSLSLLTCQL